MFRKLHVDFDRNAHSHEHHKLDRTRRVAEAIARQVMEQFTAGGVAFDFEAYVRMKMGDLYEMSEKERREHPFVAEEAYLFQ